jgi:hypothetical protein
MSVTSVIRGAFPDTYRVSTWRWIAGVFGDRHVIVIERKAYLSDFLATVTAMTLMTVLYGLILDRERISTS